MRVYIEQTSQKNILKFICDEIITPGSIELSASSDLNNSKLAQQLFQYPFIEKVFITANFVAIQKSDVVEWEDVAQSLKEIINTHLENDTIVVKEIEKIAYTLYAEMTPNPKVMKFVSNQVLSDKMIEVKSVEEADKVPLAKRLFEEFDFIEEIFISENYISVTRNNEADWQFLALEVRQFVLSYLQSGSEIVYDDYKAQEITVEAEKVEKRFYSDIEKEIQRILKEYIQPAVAKDGGNIALIGFDEQSKTATMLLQGACSGCPSSTITLKNGIETMLKELLPGQVEHVEAIND